MTEALTLAGPDAELYAVLKETVRKGMAIFFITGKALGEIKDRCYYRADGYETFDEFIDTEYGWTRRYADQLILDADVVNRLPEDFRKLITSHAAARALAQVPEILRLPVLTQASKGSSKPVSSASIKKSSPPPPKKKPASQKSAPPAKSPPRPKKKSPSGPVDATGLEVPEESRQLWGRGSEVKEQLMYLRAIKGHLSRYQAAKDILFVEVDMQSVLDRISQAISQVELAEPHAVCPSCQGKLPKDCQTCKGRGFVSQFYWDTFIPAETKALRKR